MLRSFLRPLVCLVVVLMTLLMLTGCHFHLRGDARYAFDSLQSGFDAESTLGQAFHRSLRLQKVNVNVKNTPFQSSIPSKPPQVILDIRNVQREKVSIGSTASGQVREFALRMRVVFELQTADGIVLIPETELLQQRNLGFNESNALAKESEEATLYQDLEADVAQQLLRRLASVKTLTPREK